MAWPGDFERGCRSTSPKDHDKPARQSDTDTGANPRRADMKLSTLTPTDPRLRVPCTDLPAIIARLAGEGKRVLAMDRKRDRRNGKTDYLLEVQPVVNLRSTTTKAIQ